MEQCDSDLSGQIREGFLEEMVFGLKSEGRLGKKQREEYSRQGEQRVQGLGGRRKLGGRGGVRRHLLPPQAKSLFQPPPARTAVSAALSNKCGDSGERSVQNTPVLCLLSAQDLFLLILGLLTPAPDLL